MRVVAIEQGFDNLVVRNVGDVFDMPDDSFDPRPKLDPNGKEIPGKFHEPPSWFEPLDEKDKKRVQKQRDDQDRLLMPINPAQQAAAHEIANQKIAEDRQRSEDLAEEQAKAARIAGKQQNVDQRPVNERAKLDEDQASHKPTSHKK